MSPQEMSQAFAAWLRAARTAAGVTQKRVADDMTARGFSFIQTTVAKIEYGERPVRIEEAAALAGLFGATLDAALGLNPSHAAAACIALAERRTKALALLRDQINAELATDYSTADEVVEEKATPEGEATPADVTVYRAEYEHEPFPIGLYSNSAAARAHCEHLVRQEWTPSTPLSFEWSVDEDEPEVIELDVRVETDSWSTGYTVKAVVADAEFDPEADA